MLLRQWAVDDNLVILSTELIMQIVHCKEFVKLAFQAFLQEKRQLKANPLKKLFFLSLFLFYV